MKKKYLIIGITITFLLIAGVCYSCSYQDSNASGVLVTSLNSIEKDNAEQNSTEQSPESDIAVTNGEQLNVTIPDNSEVTSIYVHICGAVVKPGVYQIESNARLIDIIKIAGGLSKAAAGDYMNQAQPVSDGQRIYIPTKDEVKELSAQEYLAGNSMEPETDQPEEAKLININQADEEELMNLPGIGEAKAKNIIDYRKTKGNFKTIKELMNIPGIKEGLFKQISTYITV